MLYTEYLETVKECPFCVSNNRIIKENEHAFLTYSLAPYYEHHLLALPRRHVESFLELAEEEARDIEELVRAGAKLLELFGHEDYSILVRNGDDSGKSVKHLHYHVVPHVHIGNVDYGGADRRVMTESEIDAFMRECDRLKPML